VVNVRFEFATATRIIFGPGTLGEVGPIAAALGDRALLVTGRSKERVKPLVRILEPQGIALEIFAVGGEPTVTMVQEAAELAKRQRCGFVVGFGGGSTLDTAKAAAALITNGGELLDYLEVIGQGKPITRPSAPLIAIPTTAGSGAEVTANAVLASPKHRVKVSLRSPLMLSRLALVDPALTFPLPPSITATTGLDALTQLIEPFVSNKANPFTDGLCREGMRRAARSLRDACEHGDDMAAREDMACASLFGGLALANGKLGAVHGFAAPFGGMFPGPHGGICARLLPYVMSMNARVLKRRESDNPAFHRYDEIAKILTGRSRARAEDGIMWVRELCDDLKVPPLAAWGLQKEDFPLLIRKASAASSMQGNPVRLTPEEMEEILTHAM
jgi:alcohol dehydrogenase class IV